MWPATLHWAQYTYRAGSPPHGPKPKLLWVCSRKRAWASKTSCCAWTKGPTKNPIGMRPAGAIWYTCHVTPNLASLPSRRVCTLHLTGPYDGLLLASEVSDVRLNDALVFLAACETGQGRATADGVVGLGRAFLEAGARAVILSLWKVEDAATAALSNHFYEALLAGEESLNAVDALRAPMLATKADLEAGRLLNADKHPLELHPANWAPFAVLGDGLSVRYS